MESDEQIEQTRKTGTDSQVESRWWLGRRGIGQKEKGFMDMDHSVVIAGEHKGTK